MKNEEETVPSCPSDSPGTVMLSSTVQEWHIAKNALHEYLYPPSYLASAHHWVGRHAERHAGQKLNDRLTIIIDRYPLNDLKAGEQRVAVEVNRLEISLIREALKLYERLPTMLVLSTQEAFAYYAADSELALTVAETENQ